MKNFYSFIEELVIKILSTNSLSNLFLKDLFIFIIFLVSFSILYKIAKNLILRFLKNKLKATLHKSHLSLQIMADSQIFERCLGLIYFLSIYSVLKDLSFPDFIAKLSFIGVSINSFLLINEGLISINKIYVTFKIAKKNPIKGYLQLVKITLYILVIIITIGVITNKSPQILLGGIGAVMAIILLIFRDTILSLVASIQIFSNRLISTEDWIEVPAFGVDGEVTDITLHQVIIKNWDKSLTVIPIYKLMNNGFKNWTNMFQEGRRIKKSFWINQNTVIFFAKNKIENLKKITGEKNLFKNDKELKTNLFYFRQYATFYLKKHPKIYEEKTLIVRTLNSTIDGIPMQIYAFCKETNWEAYEEIQSEIAEHLTAMSQTFDLKIFQRRM